MGRTGCPEMSITNYQYTPRNMPEERKCHGPRSLSIKLRPYIKLQNKTALILHTATNVNICVWRHPFCNAASVDTTRVSPDLLCCHSPSHRLLLQKTWDPCPCWATKENKLSLLNQKLFLRHTAHIRWTIRRPVTTFAQVYSTTLSVTTFIARSKWMIANLKQYARKRSRPIWKYYL